jgi:hypothetical protein
MGKSHSEKLWLRLPAISGQTAQFPESFRSEQETVFTLSAASEG